MDEEQYAAPVKHGVISGTATTAMEAGRSGLKGLGNGLLVGLGVTAGLLTLGSLAFGGTLLGALAFGLIGTAAVAGLSMIGVPFVGGIIGLGVGIGTLFGLAKGTSRGIERVSNERASAEMLNAEIQMAKAQQQGPQTVVYNNSVSPEEAALLEARQRQGGKNGSFADNVTQARDAALAQQTTVA